MLKALSLVVMLFSGGAVMDKPAPVRDAGVADAGVVQTATVKARRESFKTNMAKSAVAMGKFKHGTVSVTKILWSTLFTTDEVQDSALVLLNTPDGEVGLMVVFNDGKWDSIPDDFRP